MRMAREFRQANSSRYRFGGERRLRKTSQFQWVFSARLSVADDRLIVYGRVNDVQIARIGLSVGRKFGPAVRRNRCKRALREAFRLRQHELPAGYDYVLLPRATAAPLREQYEQSLMQLCRRIERKSDRRKSQSGDGRQKGR